MLLLIYFLVVSTAIIKECFASNNSLINCYLAPDYLIRWFATLNSVCKELGASKLQRDSVPQGELSELQIKQVLLELQRSSAPWNKMKLIVLGHGRIGKTTLLTAMHNILDPASKGIV